MSIVSSAYDIRVEACITAGVILPSANPRFRRQEIQVVIQFHGGSLIRHSSRFANSKQAFWPRYQDIVLEHIAGHVELHLEFAGIPTPCVILVQRVVDDEAVFSNATLGIITANRNTRVVAEIDQIISRRDVTGRLSLVLAGQFNAEIRVMDDVLFNQDTHSAVYVNPVGILLVAVGGISF